MKMVNPELQEIFEKYREGIPLKIKMLKSLTKDVEKKGSPEDIQKLKDFLHKTVGNSLAYGYPEASKACREYEEYLKKESNTCSDWKNRCETFLDNIIEGYKIT